MAADLMPGVAAVRRRKIFRRPHDLAGASRSGAAAGSRAHLSRVSASSRQAAVAGSAQSIWRRSSCPMLFLQGTRDELADMALMRTVTERLGRTGDAAIVRGRRSLFPRARAQWAHGSASARLNARCDRRVDDDAVTFSCAALSKVPTRARGRLHRSSPRMALSTPASAMRDRQRGTDQQVVDAQSGVAPPAPALVVPERIHRFIGMK